MYSSNAADSVSYVQATSPQPSGFPAIAVSRAPLNYSPVSNFYNYSSSTEINPKSVSNLMHILNPSLQQGPLIPAAFTNGYH
jgi:hypothetical protein